MTYRPRDRGTELRFSALRQSKNINYTFSLGEQRGEGSFGGGRKVDGEGGASLAIRVSLALGDTMSMRWRMALLEAIWLC